MQKNIFVFGRVYPNMYSKMVYVLSSKLNVTEWLHSTNSTDRKMWITDVDNRQVLFANLDIIDKWNFK